MKTDITVSSPVQVTGATLQPDVKYVFRRVDGAGLNNVIRVLNGDETRVIATFFAVSDQRLKPADHTVVTFYETAPVTRKRFAPGSILAVRSVLSSCIQRNN